MTIKRYVAEKDTVITNAFESNLSSRSTDLNAGASDVLETFVVYAQGTTSSLEQARILVQFPISDIYADIASGTLPDSGVSFYLKMFNVAHGETQPFDYDLEVIPISQSWNEGHGLTLPYEGLYYTGSGASWYYRENSSSLGWSSYGADTSGSALSVHFNEGDEDLELDISGWVNQWVNYEASSSDQQNFGLMVKHPDSIESGSRTFFTKRFSARTTEYFFKKPIVEARFNNALADDRGNFYASSSLIADIKNKVWFYNKPRGVYSEVPSTPLKVRFFTSEGGSTELTPDEGAPITASMDSTGKYYITCSINTGEEVIWDRWYDSADVCLSTSSIDVNSLAASSDTSIGEYYITVPKLKAVYRKSENNTRVEIFIRDKEQSSTIYTVASATIENKTIEKVFYQVRRVVDDLIVVDFNTDDDENATLLSYDSGGNYFNFDMSMLEKDYMYEFVFAFKIDGVLRVQQETFKFRVEK